MKSEINSQLDPQCRALQAILEMTQGPALVRLEYPVYMTSLGREVDVEVRAWRCEHGHSHVQVEIKENRVYDWNKEHSDELLFGDEPGDPGSA